MCYRITKYNPAYRDTRGAYTRNEWISHSEVGAKFNGVEFTSREYLKTEDAYVNAILLFVKFLNVKFFTIKDLEKGRKPQQNHFYSLEMVKKYEFVHNNSKIEIKDALIVARLCLREGMWCELKSEAMFVHFGYDYYMYIGSQRTSVDVLENIEKSGLFVEEYTYPYSPVEEE